MVLKSWHRESDRERGAALILVIWAVGLMAAIAAIVIANARLAGQEARTLRGGAVAKALSEAGIRYGTQLWRSGDTRIQQGTYRCAAPTGYLRLDVVPAAARVDVNLANERQLEALFIVLGAERETARAAAASVADYRDADRTPRAHGGEDQAYERAGLPYGPKNDLLESVSELAHIPAIPGWLFSAAYPHLTTRGNLVPDAIHADPVVRAASEATPEAAPAEAIRPRRTEVRTRPDATPNRSVPLRVRSAARGMSGGHYAVDAEVLGAVTDTTAPYIARLDVIGVEVTDFGDIDLSGLPRCDFGMTP